MRVMRFYYPWPAHAVAVGVLEDHGLQEAVRLLWPMRFFGTVASSRSGKAATPA
jgi:hypothetical protein